MAFDFPNAPTVGQTYQGYTWDGEKWIASQSGGGGVGRTMLSADTTYFVRTDGNDANNGLTNSPGGAFLTIPKAMSVAAALDTLSYQLTISAQAGTFTTTVALPRMVGGKAPILTGVGSTTIINVASGTCIDANGSTPWVIQNLKLLGSGGGSYSIKLSNGAAVVLGAGMDFGQTPGYHIYNQGGCSVTIAGDYTISGGASDHIVSNGWVNSQGRTVTLTGTPAFLEFFCIFNLSGASYFAPGMTFIGTATGARFNVSNAASIYTGGGGPNYFPGNAAGSGSTPGVAPYGSYA
ncbi:hypothetical protein ACKWRH_23535 [Bradyrhizobium sp. Pa8]|uniref:hypothetical protein n=1 Tax=Bradyrhizobium sp. Pa8 TaxID=3386552 RepID=UPI00403F3303